MPIPGEKLVANKTDVKGKIKIDITLDNFEESWSKSVSGEEMKYLVIHSASDHGTSNYCTRIELRPEVKVEEGGDKGDGEKKEEL
jgi:hypothetical protein